MIELICDADGIRLSPDFVLAERRGAIIVPHHAHEIFRRLAPEFGADFDWARPNGAVGCSYGSSDTAGQDREAHRKPPDIQVAQELLFARPPVIPDDELPEFKEPIPRLSGKEGSKDIPSWARGKPPRVGESGRDFAKRLMDEKYGPGNWNKNNPEYKELQKKGDRSFRDPKSFVLPYDDGA